MIFDLGVSENKNLKITQKHILSPKDTADLTTSMFFAVVIENNSALKTIVIIDNDDTQAICLQVWLFGTTYEVYCVINNLKMANKVLNNFVPDILMLQANMLQKTEQYCLDLSKIKPQSIVLLQGEGQPIFQKNNYKTLTEPFDRNELLSTLDEMQFGLKPEMIG